MRALGLGLTKLLGSLFLGSLHVARQHPGSLLCRLQHLPQVAFRTLHTFEPALYQALLAVLSLPLQLIGLEQLPHLPAVSDELPEHPQHLSGLVPPAHRPITFLPQETIDCLPRRKRRGRERGGRDQRPRAPGSGWGVPRSPWRWEGLASSALVDWLIGMAWRGGQP